MISSSEFAGLVAAQYRPKPVTPIGEFAELVRFEPDPWEEWQLEFLNNNDNQVALNCHRGAGKSAIVSVKALHQIVTVPGYQVLVLSRNDEAAMQLTAYVKKRYGMLQDSPKPVKDNDHHFQLPNGAGITSIPCTDDSPRSYHVDMMVEDEAACVPLAVHNTARPTVLAKHGRYVILSTPQGKFGHFYDIIAKRSGWSKFEITWHKTKRWTPEQLAKIQQDRTELGEDWFQQEYECQFLNVSGQLFSERDIERATAASVPQDDLQGLTWANA